jgi:putative sterol carrier protein
MIHDAFSASWARAWQELLNSSATYAKAAATWEGSVALVMTPSPADGLSAARGVFLDLWHGHCREARVASPADLQAAAYVLEAPPPVWKGVMAAELSPLVALMAGKLRLTRGNIMSLLPYAGAARELVTAASGIKATFPEGP